ncbi:hypothetical protein YC2023_112573 [Brassica napus]
MLVCLWWQQSNASEDQQKDSEKQRGTPQDRWPRDKKEKTPFSTHIENNTKKMKLNNIQAHVSSPHSNLNLEELQTTILSRARSLSETALKVLLWERDKLTLEQRFIEDEIAKCDQRIKNIKGTFPFYFCASFLHELECLSIPGIVYIGDWKLQLETILKSCNEAYPRGSLQKSYDKSACQSNKRLKPLPSTKSMCRKLDDICLENNWVLPSYHVSLSDGGFKAEVRINETQFAHRICGEAKSDAEEARESAAAILLAKYVTPEQTNSQRSRTRRPFRSPSSVKILKQPSTPGETSEEDPLTSFAIGDVDLTTNLFLALRKLRSLLVKECPGGVMGTYIFTNPTLQKISTKIPRNKEELLEIEGLGKDKVSRYGDRLLETIESTIKEYYATNKKSSME